MQLTIAAAAFDPRAGRAVNNAKAACGVAASQGCDLIVLPGLSWRRADIANLSREAGNIAVCAFCASEGGAVFSAGEVLLVQTSLYGDAERGEDVAIYEMEGVSLALLAGPDAAAPQAARLAALRGAQLLLCPVERDENDAGPWAQAQQNGVFAAVAPASGEARVIAPLSAQCPTGVLARGKQGTMAIARVSLMDWARAKLSYDPLGLLNRPFAAAMPTEDAKEPPAEPLKVAAVQRTLDFAGGRKKLIARMDELCARAAEQGCRMIAFPEYNWLDALGSYPLLSGWNDAANAKLAGAPDELDDTDAEAVARFFPETPTFSMPFAALTALRATARSIERLAVRETARLAKEHGIVMHGGTFLEKRKRKLYNTAVIAFPDGGVLRQRKLHPTRSEAAMGILPGSELSAFEVGGALCCAPVCMDATYYEPFAAARKVGCDVAIVPIFNDEIYYCPAAKRGAYARAIENGMYIVKPALTGVMLGAPHTGYAGVYGPRGAVALSAKPVGDELVMATLDFEELRLWRAALPAPNLSLEETIRRAYSTVAK